MKSSISGLYRLSIDEKIETVCQAAGIEPEELDAMWGETGLPFEQAEAMIENVVGMFQLPLGICTNLQVNGKDRLVPMVIEESSVVAAASNAAKMLRAGGGITATSTEPIMIGQIQLMDLDDLSVASEAILAQKEALLDKLRAQFPAWEERGGGPVDLEVRRLPPLDENDPLPPMLVVHILVDVRDAMGANAVNSMCEFLAPTVAEITGGRVRLRILSNLTDRRLVTVKGRVPVEAFVKRGKPASFGHEVAKGIEEASVFAERDPYRAATHNKGIMNGVDAVLMATGQDYRAVEAGVHAYAAQESHYSALSRWRYKGEYLEGEMTLPLAVGTVGGIIKVHPTVQAGIKLMQVERAHQLAEIAAAVGLAQNLAALRALAAEGIQKGHMRLHSRNIAMEVGATPEEVPALAAQLEQQDIVSHSVAQRLLEELRS
ncbi:MAG: hydroxymethylglutaryl-CoA reductase, degradative [Deltaproteobacteria bacterium]|nr:MAG: hydroxymethylglutaryl-CoA reductase, degradative [Deltaproteobacteria bacterium]